MMWSLYHVCNHMTRAFLFCLWCYILFGRQTGFSLLQAGGCESMSSGCPLRDVIDSCTWVASQSKHVKIDKKGEQH